MMKSKELRAKAWASLKGKYWKAFFAVIVCSLLVSIGTGLVTASESLLEVLNLVDPADMDETMELGAAVVNGIALVMSLGGLLVSTFVGNAALVGLANYFIQNTDSNPSLGVAFSGFKVRYGRNSWALLLMGIKVVLWSFLFVIPGIIKTFEYAIIPYILADDPEISTKDAFKKARELMKGNKWRLFKLDFSFIGWYVLCVVTLGIGTIFLMPYIEAATAEFYVELKNQQK